MLNANTDFYQRKFRDKWMERRTSQYHFHVVPNKFSLNDYENGVLI